MTSNLVSVKDDSQSSTCGIQEAIDQLGDQGGVVMIPAGRHQLRRAIRLRPRITLRGQGPATILTRPPLIIHNLIRDSLADVHELELNDAHDMRVGDQIRIMDSQQPMYHSREGIILTIDGRTLTYSVLSGESHRSYRTEHDAWAGNLFPAVVATRSNDIAIESLAIDGGDLVMREDRSGDFLAAAIHTLKCHNLRLRDLTIRRWPADGISVQGGSAIVTGCVVEDCLGSGLHPGSAMDRSIWTGNISQRNRDGFFFCSTVQNAVVANNVFIENRRHGIWGLGDPDRGNVVVGNICARNGEHGIEASRASGNVIAGNLLRNNSQNQPNASAALWINDHQENLVLANLCLDDQEHPTQTTGVQSHLPRGSNYEMHNPLIIRNQTPAPAE